MAKTTQDSQEDKDKTQALSIKLNLITKQSYVAYLAVVINSLFFLYITWEEAFRFYAITWAVLVNLLAFIRFLFLMKWRKKTSWTLDEIQRQHVLFIFGSALSGSLWGYLGWLYYESSSAFSHSIALFLLTGMTAGAVGAYSSSLPVLISYLIPALTPFIIRSFYSPNPLDVVMGLVTFLYLGLMIKIGRNANRTTIETINLTHQNDILAAERRAASRLLANVSHEIRTPLAAINGYVDLMQMEAKLDSENAESLSVIKRSSEHLLAVVDDLLDLSRLHAGKAQVHYAWFAPMEEINDIIQLSEPRNTNKIKITVQKDPFVPEKIYSDPKIFRQIFINLLTNAQKFTPKGHIRILVRMEPDDRRQNLIVEVSDSGVGIEPSLIPRIFQPFARGTDSYIQSMRGSGLGLALSKDLSHLLDGDLILKQTFVGVGTTFSFSINAGLRQGTPPPDDVNKHSPVDLLGLNDRLKGISVLIVDDAPDLLSLIRRILSRYDIKVETKRNGLEAIEEAKRRSYDLILMDLSMPVLDGCQATKILRNIGYTKPILALTAHTSEEHYNRCIEAGFDGFLKKPFDRPDLLQTIAYWVQPKEKTGMARHSCSRDKLSN